MRLLNTSSITDCFTEHHYQVISCFNRTNQFLGKSIFGQFNLFQNVLKIMCKFACTFDFTVSMLILSTSKYPMYLHYCIWNKPSFSNTCKLTGFSACSLEP